MPDPLAVRQIQLKECLCYLESMYRTSSDVNARVSAARRQRLRNLRTRLVRAQAGSSRTRAREVTDYVAKAVASELLLWMVETSFSYAAVRSARLVVYSAVVFCSCIGAEVWRTSQAPYIGPKFCLPGAA